MQTGGMTKHQHIASGDDDLFIRDAATKKNTTIILDKESFTYSEPAKSWTRFFQQKTRHVTTSVSYKLIHKCLLFVFAASHISFYLLIIGLSMFGHYAYLVEGTILFFLISMSIFALLSKKFDEQDLIAWFPILDFGFFVYLIFLSPYIFIRKQSW